MVPPTQIHAGIFEKALRLIRSARKNAQSRNDIVTIRMCDSAQLFCKRVRRACKHEPELLRSDEDLASTRKRVRRSGEAMSRVEKKKSMSSIVHTSTVDDYQRIRIVRDRTRAAI